MLKVFGCTAALSLQLGIPGVGNGILIGTQSLAVAVGSVDMAIMLASLGATLMPNRFRLKEWQGFAYAI